MPNADTKIFLSSWKDLFWSAAMSLYLKRISQLRGSTKKLKPLAEKRTRQAEKLGDPNNPGYGDF